MPAFMERFYRRPTRYLQTRRPARGTSPTSLLLGGNRQLMPPRFPAQLMGWDDPVAGDLALGCLPDRVPGTDVIVVRRVSADTIAAAAVDVRNIYVQASQCINDPTLLSGFQFGRAVQAANRRM